MPRPLARSALAVFAPLMVGFNGWAEPKAAEMPGPARGATSGDPAARNAACEGCHQEIASEWRASKHRAAYTEIDFQKSLMKEPMPFCRGCHAPEANPKTDPPRDRAELGVGCVSCHSPRGTKSVLAGTYGNEGTSVSPAGHRSEPLRRDPQFAGDGACGECHQFGFPDNARRPSPLFMQETMAEAARLSNGASCNDCHMRAVGGTPKGPGVRPHRDHRFAVDAPLLRGSLAATAERTGGRVTLTLAPRGVGHSFPTGDLFRRLVVTFRTPEFDLGPEGSLPPTGPRRLPYFRTKEYPLVRAWGDRVGESGVIRYLESDTRLQGAPKSFTFDSNVPVEWTVTYDRAATRTDAHGRVPVESFGSVELAHGTE